MFPDALVLQLSCLEVCQDIQYLQNFLAAKIALRQKINVSLGIVLVTDPSFSFSCEWNLIEVSSHLKVPPYPSLWLEFCDAHCGSYRLVSSIFVMEKYLNSPQNYAQCFYIRMSAINIDNVAQPV